MSFDDRRQTYKTVLLFQFLIGKIQPYSLQLNMELVDSTMFQFLIGKVQHNHCPYELPCCKVSIPHR